MLQMISHEPENSPEASIPLVIAHGLFGSGRNWGVIAKRLANHRRVIALDMRNHGASLWHEDHNYHALAADIAEVATNLGQPVDLLGHSMGGKAAMVAALSGAPIRRLIVADIAPVGYNHSQQPVIDAMQSLPLDHITSRAEADQALSAHIDDPALRSFLLQSLNVSERRWRLNLLALSASMDQIIGFPDISGCFNAPALFLTGALSDYLRPEHRPIIKALFPKARFAKIPQAGHWLHAEKPHEFEAAVRVFLEA
ncbi:alpha/beta fold hydrolase [Planktomarina sp.]|uniref:alpha/beta fold hydrolase n=1 Tax=Planktomarina sp. TaxID=2024851 RepID=UPI0028901E05|nr:alpha/beta fold hydrolase [Planktomarina sp.]MDT2071246.1 alpha/beta fold hydrolase [Planktomarina sp.]